jgi:hypothetical protein
VILSLCINLYMAIMMFAPMNSSFFADSTTRGHQYKIHKQYCSVNAFKYNFPNRCIDAWNSLPANVVNAVTLRDFNRKLDDVDFNHFFGAIHFRCA